MEEKQVSWKNSNGKQAVNSIPINKDQSVPWSIASTHLDSAIYSILASQKKKPNKKITAMSLVD